MKYYKGFSKGLFCNGKQYSENTIFEEDIAILCNSGMHFCDNPVSVLRYYPIMEKCEFNEFAEVVPYDEVVKKGPILSYFTAKPFYRKSHKCCTKKLKIKNKIDVKDYINLCVEYLSNPLSGIHRHIIPNSNGVREYISDEKLRILYSQESHSYFPNLCSDIIFSLGEAANIDAEDAKRIYSCGKKAVIENVVDSNILSLGDNANIYILPPSQRDFNLAPCITCRGENNLIKIMGMDTIFYFNGIKGTKIEFVNHLGGEEVIEIDGVKYMPETTYQIFVSSDDESIKIKEENVLRDYISALGWRQE